MLHALLLSLPLSTPPDPPKPDPAKNEETRTTVGYGGHVRLRSETWTGFGFGAPVGVSHHDTFLLGRLIAHVDLRFPFGLGLFLEGKSAPATDRDLPGGTRTLDEDAIDLHQGYVRANVACAGDLELRAGRFQLSLGAQRLVSPLPWGNTLRHWDGLLATTSVAHWDLTGFVTNFAPADPDRFDRRRDIDFHGLQAERRFEEGGSVAGYALFFDRPTGTYNGTTGDERRWTLGARWHRPQRAGALDFDVEAAWQTGEVGSADANAYMVGAQVGRTTRAGTPLRYWIGLDYATGDDAAGGDVETFQQLFPLGHAYLGMTDTVGRQNVLDVSAGVHYGTPKDLRIALAAHSFRLADASDALYNAGGGVVRPGGASSSRSVGEEVSLQLRRDLSENLALEVGYARFLAGDVIEDSGPDEDIGFFYTQLLLRF